MNKDTNITPNFRFGEFYCHGVRPPDEYIPNIIEVARQLQKLRDVSGKMIRVNSGYRTKEWNKQVGGSSKSQHLSGRAADISCNVNMKELLFLVGRYTDFKGIGIADRFIHLDIRDNQAIWYY